MDPKVPQAAPVVLRGPQLVRHFLKERSGAGAIEFAIVAPLLIGIYISSFEITTGYTAARNVLKAAGTIADVVTRQPSVDKAFLSQMIDTAEATIAPHSATGLKLKISGITIDSASNPTVLWSWDQDGGAPYATGSAVNVPTDMRAPASFLVRAELSVPHTMLLFMGTGAGFSSSVRSLTLRREFYYRQRLSEEIPCSDCS
jgi:Flp pilus assembly protein TadG